jgi:hypothetical protein
MPYLTERSTLPHLKRIRGSSHVTRKFPRGRIMTNIGLNYTGLKHHQNLHQKRYPTMSYGKLISLHGK